MRRIETEWSHFTITENAYLTWRDIFRLMLGGKIKLLCSKKVIVTLSKK